MIREVGDIITVDLDIMDREMYLGDWSKIETGQIVAILARDVYLFRNSWNEQRITESEIK
tara:strand:+ start:12744 stop:12923 length:180 start_codon:yes stop_codon:yes gene_type:complete